MWSCGRIDAAVLKKLNNSTIETTPNNLPEVHFSVNDFSVKYLGGKWERFLGYLKENGKGDNYLLEHFERVKTSNDMLRKYPAAPPMMLLKFPQNKLFM